MTSPPARRSRPSEPSVRPAGGVTEEAPDKPFVSPDPRCYAPGEQQRYPSDALLPSSRKRRKKNLTKAEQAKLWLE